MKKDPLKVVGLMLLGLGIYMLLAEYGLIFRISFSNQLFLIVVGAAMLLAFFHTKPQKTYLIWGNILIFLGIGLAFTESASYFIDGDHKELALVAFIGLAIFTSGLMSKDHRYLISYGVPTTIGGIMISIYYWRKNLNLRLWDDDIVLLGAIFILAGIKLVLDVWFGKKAEKRGITVEKS